jgi:hypothetical protein
MGRALQAILTDAKKYELAAAAVIAAAGVVAWGLHRHRRHRE